ncbi:hypothetical protein GIB67_034835, partial [Kingdonia uniflora]
KDGAVLLQVLRSRREVILDNIRDNDKAGANYQKEVEGNKKHRCQLQDMIEEATSNNTNETYLRFLKFLRMNLEQDACNTVEGSDSGLHAGCLPSISNCFSLIVTA